ncbi:MAG: hypothetical protein WD065_04580, partial [Planctomycetaceae bacterium]
MPLQANASSPPAWVSSNRRRSLLHAPHAWCGFVPSDCVRGQTSLCYIGERPETNVFVDTFKELKFKNPDELAGLLHFLSGFHESSRLMSGA